MPTSTGLAAHTNWHKALLAAIYEIIERDSFVLTWYQKIIPPKIIIAKAIRNYLEELFPVNYEWHFFDMTYDLGIPSILCMCFGEIEFRKFICVSAATNGTLGSAMRDAINEIGQSIPGFRPLSEDYEDWIPKSSFSDLTSFKKHSIFYMKRPDLSYVFDKYRNAKPRLKIDFYQEEHKNTQDQINYILKILENKNYDVLAKDITTPDVNQAGFHSIRVIIPQLLGLGGRYPYYFLGGERLYEVPLKMGYKSLQFEELNKFPHPFP